MARGLYVKDLHNYEACPARFLFEKKKRKGEAVTRYEVFQLLFKQYFRMMSLDRHNPTKMHSTVNQYAHVLFPEGKVLSSEVMVAYSMKCFEKLYYDIISQGTYFLPDTFVIDFEQWEIYLGCDLIYTGYTSEDTKIQEITFVYLVPNDRWYKTDLANRFEIYLSFKYLLPLLRKDRNIRGSVIFLNYENGKQCKITSSNLGSLSGFKGRLRNLLKSIDYELFGKRPIEALCKECPHLVACNPANKYQQEEIVQVKSIS